MKVIDKLFQAKETKGAVYFVLIDPDKQDIPKAVNMAKKCEKADVDPLLVGGSLLFALFRSDHTLWHVVGTT